MDVACMFFYCLQMPFLLTKFFQGDLQRHHFTLRMQHLTQTVPLQNHTPVRLFIACRDFFCAQEHLVGRRTCILRFSLGELAATQLLRHETQTSRRSLFDLDFASVVATLDLDFASVSYWNLDFMSVQSWIDQAPLFLSIAIKQLRHDFWLCIQGLFTLIALSDLQCVPV